MAKIKKKGTSGAAKNFITRSSAIRKLQISLPDFRRLCIYKGIYPREPRNKKKAAKSSTPSTTFYYTKDIQYLLHEPLLAKLRDRYALLKKIQRALGRGEAGDASRLERTQMPKMRLDHIVKERYPTFIDAIRDLDDCLSMLFLFANLPSSDHVPTKTIALCKRLCLEFEHYLIVSHSLRRSFLSIKGIYYGAEIQGQDILWLAPYKFVQQVTGDVDFRIMATFVEFYTCLLSFVNYRLYTSIGLVYPPKFNALSDEQGGELGAFSLEGLNTDANNPPAAAITNGASHARAVNEEATAKAQAAVKSLSAIAEPVEPEQSLAAPTQDIDQFTSTDPAADILAQPSLQSSAAGTLFKDFSFYLSRETPRAPLEFLLRAFGCRHIGWDELSGGAGAWTNNELDARITHQIVDRPPMAPSNDDNEAPQRGGRVAGRTYIQPQWVWDCVNAGKLLRPDLYAPGATLPPHLSPWMKDKQRAGDYDPTAPLADLMENGSHVNGEDDDKDESVVEGVDSVKALGDLNGVDGEDEEEDDEDMEEDDSEEDEEDEANGDFDGFSEDETAGNQHQRELEAEAAGLPAPKPKAKSKSSTPQARAARQEQEQRERQVMMLSRRQAKLYGRMQHSKGQQDAEREKLQGRKRALAEAAKKQAAAGAGNGNPKRRRVGKA